MKTSVVYQIAATSLYRDRLLVGSVSFLTLLVVIAFALYSQPSFMARSLLLVLPSSDYGTSVDAEGKGGSAAILERESYLMTETKILTSISVERAAIETVGLSHIYPALAGLTRSKDPDTAGGQAATRAMELALIKFGKDLTATPDKVANTVVVGFRNPSAKIASEVVNTLVSLYLAKRATLYNTLLASALAEQVRSSHDVMDRAATAYHNYQISNHIVDYDAQRAMLLRNVSDLTTDVQATESALSQATNRLGVLESQLASTASQVVIYAQTDFQDKALTAMSALNALRVREAGLAVHQLDKSPEMIEVKRQIAAAEVNLAHAQQMSAPSTVRQGPNPLLDRLKEDRAKTQQDLAVSNARLEADKQRIGEVQVSLQDLQAKEEELHRLQQQHDMADENYATLAKIFSQRQALEAVNSGKSSNVRVLEPAQAPLRPSQSRLLTIAAGIVLSLVFGCVAAVLSALLRPGFICAEQLEADLNVPILSIFPDVAVRRPRRSTYPSPAENFSTVS
jgi:uncharacterized protein involved in exopolysaccharide biosynthesis